MAKYNLTNKAVSDLADIWNYTYDEWSENQADKNYQALLDRCQEIADKPTIGKNYSDITKSLYGLKTEKHIIFYRIISSLDIEITRILYRAMDLKKRILE